MGYGTVHHLNGIREHGITEFHRADFGICKTAHYNPIISGTEMPGGSRLYDNVKISTESTIKNEKCLIELTPDIDIYPDEENVSEKSEKSISIIPTIDDKPSDKFSLTHSKNIEIVLL